MMPQSLLLPPRLALAALATLARTAVFVSASASAAASVPSFGHGLGCSRAFSTAAAALLATPQLPPRPRPPPETELEENFVKGSGPGGQKINKTNSACQLKHIPTGIVVKSQATRSREQNRKIARDLLAARLDDLRNGAGSRSAVVGDVKHKRRASADKKSRRKYKLLTEAKEEGSGARAGVRAGVAAAGSKSGLK